MKSFLLSTMSLLLLASSLKADVPFRQHRYDSWRSLQLPQKAIVFVGNSITDMHNWREAFGGDCRIVNRGNSGALSHEVLLNMDSWLYAHPAKVFLMIGTNDLGSGITADSVVRNITIFVQRVRQESPETDIYLQSILPARDQSLRTLATIQHANRGIKAIADTSDRTTYVDLYSTLSNLVEDSTLSFDRLHLTAKGYQLWCAQVAPLLGLSTVYSSRTASRQYAAGLGGSHGMRATYFSVLPLDRDDVLFFGDELAKNGEWDELLPGRHVKNRATGWGYGGSIRLTRAMVEATFHRHRTRVAAAILYTATDDLNSTRPLDSIMDDYRLLVQQLQQHTRSGRVVLVSPLAKQGNEERVAAFKKLLADYAETVPNLFFVDVFSALNNTEMIRDNYLYGAGYRVVADRLGCIMDQMRN